MKKIFFVNMVFLVIVNVAKTQDLDSLNNKILFIKNNDLQIELVYVKGDTFQMGSNDIYASKDEQPIHRVILDDFYLSKYEITNRQYCAFLNDNEVVSKNNYSNYIKLYKSYCQIEHSNNKFVSKKGKEDYPVIAVTWDGAWEFCRWVGGELPTEARWEYAARGGTKSRNYKYAGSNKIDEVAWYWENSYNAKNKLHNGKGTHPVGQKKSNELGLYDMSGNVSEWCWDWYDGNCYGDRKDITLDPVVILVPGNWPMRVLRGGPWRYNKNSSETTDRGRALPIDYQYWMGFRLCVPKDRL